MAQQPDQQSPQRSAGDSSIAPRRNATGRVLGVMCIVLCCGLIAATMMYVKANGQALRETQRANAAEMDLVVARAGKALAEQTVQSEAKRADNEAERANASEQQLGEAKAKLTQLERMTAGGNGDIGKEQVERLLASEKKRADRYWRALSPEKQHELEGGGLRIEDVAVDHDGKMAHVTLSNGSDRVLLNVEVRIIFWDRDVMAYVQPEVIPSIPAKTKDGPYKHSYDIPLKRDKLNPAWRVDADVEVGGTARTAVVE